MSTTNYLNLNKHDNVTTNQNAFDIENYLNGNWDKIDQEASSQNANLELLQSENTRLKKNQIYGTATGTEVEITDGAEMGVSIGVSGESEQETRSGKNILDANNPTGTNLATVGFNNNILTVSSTVTNTTPFARYEFPISYGDIVRLNAIILDTNGQIVTQVYNGTTWVTAGTLIKNYIDGSSISPITFESTEGYTAIRFLFYSNKEVPTAETSARYKNVIVTKNDSDMAYEPYGAMPSLEFPSEIKNLTGNTVCTVRGINLLDLSKCSRFTNCILQDDGSLKSNINNSYYCNLRTTELNDFLLEHKGETITFSIDKAIQNKNVTILIQGTRTTGLTYQESVGEGSIRNVSMSIADDFTQIDYLELRWNRAFPAFTDTTTVVTELMLCLGENTDYEPYQEPKTITFPLGEQKFAKGDYLASDGIHHVRVQKVFDGTEDWVEYPGVDDAGYTYIYTNSGAKIGTQTSICSHFANKNSAWSIGEIDVNYCDHSTIASKYFVTSKETLEDWKSYLAQQYANGTPVILEYELAEPAVTAYTTAQQTAYNNLQNLILFEGYNHIEMISPNGVRANLTVNYTKSTGIVIQNLDERIQALENAILEV